MRRGVTLLELVVVLAIVSILASLVAPSASRLLQSVTVERAAQRLVAAHRVARFTAIVRGRTTLLAVTSDSLTVRAIAGVDTVMLWQAPGPAEDGVQLTGPAYALKFSPLGLPLGVSNATFRLTRGGASRQVVVSRLGRIRIARGG